MEEIHGLGLPGFLALVTGLVIFFGSVYCLVSLNVGWRFGYWLTFATIGGLLTFMSVFWLVNPVGPRGEDPLWIPLSAEQGPIAEASFEGKTFSAPAAYPGTPWQEASAKVTRGGVVGFLHDLIGQRHASPQDDSKEVTDLRALEVDPFKSAVGNCLGFDEKKVADVEEEIELHLNGWERIVLEGKFGKRDRLEREIATCSKVYSLLPAQDTLPKVNDVPVGVTYDVKEIRFTTEAGTLLAQATVIPNTYDGGYTGDESGSTAKQVGNPLTVLAYKDKGSLRYPSMLYLLFWGSFFLFHLWGLSRAERRKLSPVAA